MELSGPGVQYIADAQLYNSIITAHAILMSAPQSVVKWKDLKRPANGNNCIKNHQVGGAELHGETQTTKLMGKGSYESDAQDLEHDSHLICVTLRLTKLIKRNIHHNGIFAK